nr:chromatin modification-related protein EAF1 B-like isoform X1 [Ipomoea batatas]
MMKGDYHRYLKHNFFLQLTSLNMGSKRPVTPAVEKGNGQLNVIFSTVASSEDLFIDVALHRHGVLQKLDLQCPKEGFGLAIKEYVVRFLKYNSTDVPTGQIENSSYEQRWQDDSNFQNEQNAYGYTVGKW